MSAPSSAVLASLHRGRARLPPRRPRYGDGGYPDHTTLPAPQIDHPSLNLFNPLPNPCSPVVDLPFHGEIDVDPSQFGEAAVTPSTPSVEADPQLPLPVLPSLLVPIREEEPFGPGGGPGCRSASAGSPAHSAARASSSSGLNTAAAPFNIAGTGSSSALATARLHFSDSEASSDEAPLTRLWET